MPATATKPLEVAEVRPIGAPKSRYRWESRVGERRGHRILIDAYQDDWRHPTPDKLTTAEVQSAAWERRYTDEEKALLRQAVIDNGSDMIVFTSERGPENSSGQATTGHCWFATNSDAIAWVVRQHIAKNDPGLFIESTNVNSKTYKVGSKIFADTKAGRDLAFAEVDATGFALEVVTPNVTE